MLSSINRLCSALVCAIVVMGVYASLAPLTAYAEDLYTKEITLEGISKVALQGHSKTIVTLGETEYVRAIGTKEVLKRLDANVEGDTLNLSDRKKGWKLFEKTPSRLF